MLEGQNDLLVYWSLLQFKLISTSYASVELYEEGEIKTNSEKGEKIRRIYFVDNQRTWTMIECIVILAEILSNLIYI